MNGIKRIALKILSDTFSVFKKHYKIYRKLFEAANPYFKPKYNILDSKIIIDSREIPVRVFHPQAKTMEKALIFFHGGGWIAGDIDSYTKVCAKMADKTGHTVVSVNYRLAPENPFPAGLEDCYYVARKLFLNPDLLHCRQDDISLIGDSAGGNLAAVVSLMARDRGEFLPGKQILLYPATYCNHSDNSPFPSMRENGKNYILTAEQIQNYLDLYVADEKDRCSPYVAPLLATDLTNQPRTLIITAEFDPLRDEGEAYGQKLREFNNEVEICRIENALHGFLRLPGKAKAVQICYEKINGFLGIRDRDGI